MFYPRMLGPNDNSDLGLFFSSCRGIVLIEDIRLHGTGGQGVVACGELIAIAASYEGKFCRAFPMYGSARRGAPVVAFAQIGPESEATRSMIYYPDHVIVLDPNMVGSKVTLGGVKEGGTLVYNTSTKPNRYDDCLIGVVDATSIAVQVLGRPIPNTTILGAFAKTSGLLSMVSIEKAMDKRFPERLAGPNKEAARQGYDKTVVYGRGDEF